MPVVPRTLVEPEQWFWCSPAHREKSLERERGRNDTPTDGGALVHQQPGVNPSA
jgi:hypothetical protein